MKYFEMQINFDSIPMIQVIPMRLDEINCSSLEEAQYKFFINDLMTRESCNYLYAKKGITAPSNSLLLFKISKHFIASAIFKVKTPYPVPTNGNYGHLTLYPESIRVFNPIPEDIILEIVRPTKKPRDNSKIQINNIELFPEIISLIESNSANYTLSLECQRQVDNLLAKDCKNYSLQQLVKLSKTSPISRYNNSKSTYARNPYLRILVKKLANATCHLCEEPAPFLDNTGNPYLEVHHVVRLADNGTDDLGNVVALCPNCHRKIHIQNNISENKKLKQKANEIKLLAENIYLNLNTL